MPNVHFVAAVILISACVAWDVRERRIPNFLSLGGLLAGIAINCFLLGTAGLLQSIGGFFVALLLLLPAFAVDGIGGGDVKMMASLGAILGAKLVTVGLLLGVITGGVIMLVHLWRIGRAREKLQSTYNMIVAAFAGGSLEPLKAPAKDPLAVSLPYSVPLGLGVLLTLSLRGMMGV